ncbi:uromodulin-like 1 [Colossoma macropomum]|uniref:uromodulin-like 1 n=1 Tax=Colossoma macropomum TaxID=42526 RepID=UPI001864151A|nr:uromodulin-like 1 [Colossoma macropomum]
MCRIFSAWLVLTFLSIAGGHNTLQEGYALSLSGYHLCSGLDSVPVTSVVSSQIASSQLRPCGGWLPWKTCNVTIYTTTYKTEVNYIQKEVTRCCEGFEQVGSYCALTLNRSAEFTAKPGVCPVRSGLGPGPGPGPGPVPGPGLQCEWDTDCPGWQKCCQTENTSHCVEPHTHVNVSGWLNVTVEVKVPFHLVNTNSGLFNHTRLLHSVVTGALSFPSVSVYHVTSWPAGPVSTTSTLLLGSSDLSDLLTHAKMSTRLQLLLENIEEITAVDISDVDECVTAVLKDCAPHSNCTNTHGSYTCTCPPGSTDLYPSRPGTHCTSDLVSAGPLRKAPVEEPILSTTLSTTSFSTTSSTPTSTLTTTDPPAYNNQTLKAVTRLTNVNFTEALLNTSSEEYRTLAESIINETLHSLPPDILELVRSGKVIVQITGLSPGSVVVNFALVFLPNSTEHILNVADALMESLLNSSQFSIDRNSTVIQDVDECSLQQADCSPWADCVNTFGSYTCSCQRGYTDANPSRPGRTCQENSNVTEPSTAHPNVTESSASTTQTSATTTGHADNVTRTSPDALTTDAPTSAPGSTSTISTLSTSSTTSSTHLSTASSTTLEHPNHSQTTESPSTPLSSTTTTTTAAFLHTPIISETEAISVNCRAGSIAVFVAQEFLRLKRISEASLYLGQPHCGQMGVNSTHVQLIVAWDECGVQIHRNTTVQVMLYNNMTMWVLPNFAPIAQLEVPVICTYMNKIIISTGYESSSYLDMIDGAVLGSGTFHVTVRLLNGTTPLPQNYTLSPKDEVIIEVAVNSSVSQIKVVINKCWANPSSNPSESPQYFFLENSCPLPNTYTTVIQNGNSTRSLLAVNVFSMANLDIIYLHCQIQICIETASATCRPSCLARSTRSSNVIGTAKASCGPLLRSHSVTLEEAIQGTRIIGFILLGVGLFVFVTIGMAALSYYRKRMGNYNFHFKPRLENFTYHVFDK